MSGPILCVLDFDADDGAGTRSLVFVVIVVFVTVPLLFECSGEVRQQRGVRSRRQQRELELHLQQEGSVSSVTWNCTCSRTGVLAA